MTQIDPVVMHFEVPLAPTEAFEIFTTELDTWWPFVGHSCTDDLHAKVQFDPRVGGEICEFSANKSQRFIWGTLLEWDPPHRFAMSWHPGQAPDQATRLSVAFAATGDGCKVTLIHDGWAARGEAGAAARNMYAQGWVGVTEAYRARAKKRGG